MNEVIIKGYESYSIDRQGNVYSFKSGRKTLMKKRELNTGYYYVDLYGEIGKKPKRFLIHRLVGMAFIENPRGDICEINHKNKNRKDNRVENLEWVTRSENAYHKYKTYQYPNGSNNCRSKLTEDIVYRIKFYFIHGIRTVDVSKKMKIKQSTLNEIKHGRTWSHIAVTA